MTVNTGGGYLCYHICDHMLENPGSRVNYTPTTVNKDSYMAFNAEVAPLTTRQRLKTVLYQYFKVYMLMNI